VTAPAVLLIKLMALKQTNISIGGHYSVVSRLFVSIFVREEVNKSSCLQSTEEEER